MFIVGKYEASEVARPEGDVQVAVDAYGRVKPSGGTAGTPSGAVQSVQGVTDGTPIPSVGQGDVLDLTPVLDTGIYADNEVLFITQELANAVRVAAGRALPINLEVLDEDDQGQPFDLLFLDSNVSIGTLNAAVSITDANARKIIGRYQVLTGDYYDLGGARYASISLDPKWLKAAAASTSLWVAGVSRGTGTYTASGLKIKIGVSWD